MSRLSTSSARLYSFGIDNADDLILEMFTVEFARDLACLAYQAEFFIVFDRQKITNRRTDIDLE